MGYFFVLVLTLIASVTPFIIETKTGKVHSENTLFELQSTPQPMPTALVSDFFIEEEAEKAMIRTCQQVQKWVIACDDCIVNGTSCQPSVGFCSSVRSNVSTHNDTEYWAFLPNASGSVSSIASGSQVNPALMSNSGDIEKGARYLFANTFDFSLIAGLPFNYVRPILPSGATDPCAVEGVVSR